MTAVSPTAPPSRLSSSPSLSLSSRGRVVGFWLLAATALTFTAASSAPSPLYVVYQADWHFSALTLTLVFASYAAVLLLSLLIFGGLSDYVGRRPVIAVALLVQLVSVLAFVTAQNVGGLFAGRMLQGLATGAALGTLSAAITDLAPAGRQSLAAAINTAAPTLGLAVGSLLSGILVQYAPAPRHLVYIVLGVAFALMLVALAIVPESIGRRPGSLRSLHPRASVPPQARRAFRLITPILVAPWSIAGLMMSLGPSLAGATFGLHNHVAGGLVVTSFAGVGSVSALLVRSRPARQIMLPASLFLAAGVTVVLVSIAGTWTPLFFTGLAVTGLGFGAAFVAALGTIGPLATPDERAELFAAVFTLSYAAFGGSAVLAGLAVPHWGLRPVALVFMALVLALTLLAAAAEVTTRRSPATTQPATPTPASASFTPTPASATPPASGVPASAPPTSGAPASASPASALPASGLPASDVPTSGVDHSHLYDPDDEEAQANGIPAGILTTD